MENVKDKKLEPEFNVQKELESKIKKNYSNMLVAMSKNVCIEFWQLLLKENSDD